MKLVGQDLYRHSNFITFNLLEMSTGVINIKRLFSPMIGVEVSIICVCVHVCTRRRRCVYIKKIVTYSLCLFFWILCSSIFSCRTVVSHVTFWFFFPTSIRLCSFDLFSTRNTSREIPISFHLFRLEPEKKNCRMKITSKFKCN